MPLGANCTKGQSYSIRFSLGSHLNTSNISWAALLELQVHRRRLEGGAAELDWGRGVWQLQVNIFNVSFYTSQLHFLNCTEMPIFKIVALEPSKFSTRTPHFLSLAALQKRI